METYRGGRLGQGLETDRIRALTDRGSQAFASLRFSGTAHGNATQRAQARAALAVALCKGRSLCRAARRVSCGADREKGARSTVGDRADRKQRKKTRAARCLLAAAEACTRRRGQYGGFLAAACACAACLAASTTSEKLAAASSSSAAVRVFARRRQQGGSELALASSRLRDQCALLNS